MQFPLYLMKDGCSDHYVQTIETKRNLLTFSITVLYDKLCKPLLLHSFSCVTRCYSCLNQCHYTSILTVRWQPHIV